MQCQHNPVTAHTKNNPPKRNTPTRNPIPRHHRPSLSLLPLFLISSSTITMTPKFCIPLPNPKSHYKRRFIFTEEENTNSHTIQSALSAAKSLTVTTSRRGKAWPLKYWSPKGPALKLWELLDSFSEDIRVGAQEMGEGLRDEKRVTNCKFLISLLSFKGKKMS
jgi:hypothetical protein